MRPKAVQTRSWRTGVLQRLHPKSPPIPSFTTPYISPLIQFTWRSEWKAVSEFGPYVHRKDCRICTVCLRFNNHLRRSAPVRLKDLSWTLSLKLWINPNSPFTINLYLCCITSRRSASKINEWMIQRRAPSSGETREFIRRYIFHIFVIYKVSYAYQGCFLYIVKYFIFYYTLNCNLFLWCKAEFYWIWILRQYIFLIIINVQNSCCFIILWKPDAFLFWMFWWIEDSKWRSFVTS